MRQPDAPSPRAHLAEDAGGQFAEDAGGGGRLVEDAGGGRHFAEDAGGHRATGPAATDLSKADVGVRLLRVALHLIHDADGGDEDTDQALSRLASSLTDLACGGCGRHLTSSARCRGTTEAHPIRSWARELLALLDAGEEPPGLEPGPAPGLEPGAVRSGHPATVVAAGAPLAAHRPDGARQRSPRHAAAPATTDTSPGPLATWPGPTGTSPSPTGTSPSSTGTLPGNTGTLPSTTSTLPTAVPNGPIGPISPISRGQLLPAAAHPDERKPRMAIRCFGGFRMVVGDLVIDWTKVRPRARAAMRLLTMRAGRPVHREALIEALWPDMPAKSATANLQVAVSSLRSLLEPDRDRGKPRLVVRVGDAYLLSLPSDAYLDTLAFQTALTRGRQAKATGDTASAVQGLRDALAQYHGELLPEDGPAEWLQEDREIYRRQAADAAAELAAAELQAGNLQEAVTAAQKCLAIDRFHDTGWHLLLRAYHRIGAPAAAEQARRRYVATLASLGLDTDEPATGVAGDTAQVPHPRLGRDDRPTGRTTGRLATGRLSVPAYGQ